MQKPRHWLPFSKMHGLGNDFVVIALNAPDEHPALMEATTLRALADRHTGVGFDQAMIILPAVNAGSVASYRIFNADGGEVEQCGNGVRCVAEWLHLHDRCQGRTLITLDSASGPIEARFLATGQVSVNMGEPDFPAEPHQHLQINGREIAFTMVSMGNPHIVLSVDDIATPDVKEFGPLLERHEFFPNRTNVGFAKQFNRRQLALRVHERGVGETRACGTGACAAMAVGRHAGTLDESVAIDLPGGRLQVDWSGPGHSLWLTGEAHLAYRGELPLF